MSIATGADAIALPNIGGETLSEGQTCDRRFDRNDEMQRQRAPFR